MDIIQLTKSTQCEDCREYINRELSPSHRCIKIKEDVFDISYDILKRLEKIIDFSYGLIANRVKGYIFYHPITCNIYIACALHIFGLKATRSELWKKYNLMQFKNYTDPSKNIFVPNYCIESPIITEEGGVYNCSPNSNDPVGDGFIIQTELLPNIKKDYLSILATCIVNVNDLLFMINNSRLQIFRVKSRYLYFIVMTHIKGDEKTYNNWSGVPVYNIKLEVIGHLVATEGNEIIVYTLHSRL
jgi:hypothetical protein